MKWGCCVCIHESSLLLCGQDFIWTKCHSLSLDRSVGSAQCPQLYCVINYLFLFHVGLLLAYCGHWKSAHIHSARTLSVLWVWSIAVWHLHESWINGKRKWCTEKGKFLFFFLKLASNFCFHLVPATRRKQQKYAKSISLLAGHSQRPATAFQYPNFHSFRLWWFRRRIDECPSIVSAATPTTTQMILS